MSSEPTILTAQTGEFSPRLVGIVVPTTIRETVPLGGSIKRLMDIFLALSSLLLLVPIIAMIIVLLKICTRDSAIFAHQRVGHRGKSFKCLKFRTMVSNGDQVLAHHLTRCPEARAEWEADQKLRYDPRITPIGRVLRSSSLDELPQIFNVLQGTMSIVGPRPIVSAEIEKYGASYSAYQSCRPGITGLWQVSGRSDCGYDRRVKLDESYSQKWSMLRDCWIIWKTVGVVIKRDGSR